MQLQKLMILKNDQWAHVKAVMNLESKAVILDNNLT